MLIYICLLDDVILDFYNSSLAQEDGGFEIASTITIVIQANLLTNCANLNQNFS